MNRKTTIALAIFVGLGIAAYFVTKSPQKGERRGEKKRPIAKIDKKQITRIVLASAKNKSVELSLDGKTWRLSKPIAYAADTYAVDTLLEKLEKLEFGDLVTERADKQAFHEVDQKKGVHVQVSGKKGLLADFFVGKVNSGYTMVRPAKAKAVYQAVGSLRYVFDKELKSWRDRTIIKVKQSEVRGIAVSGPAGDISLSRKSDKEPWKVKKSSKPIDQIDKQVVTSLLSSAYSLTADDFADDAKPAVTGLDQPKAKLSLALKGGKTVTLLLGNNKKDDYWVKRPDTPQIFIIKKYTAENLLRRPIDFRDKTVLSFKAEDLLSLSITRKKDGKKTSLSLVKKGSDWLDGAKKIKDGDKVDNAVKALAALKADAFAKFPAADYGLDKPEWTLRLKLKDRSQHELNVGAKEKDGDYGLMRKGVAEIFTFRKYNVDRFLLDPAAYKAK